MKPSIFVLALIFLTSCHPRVQESNLIGLQITDIHNITETITNPQQLSAYNPNDFLKPQPYKKVIITYSPKEKKQLKPSVIISYHDNGNLKQKLSSHGLTCKGSYKEWFPNGQLKVSATLSGGEADFTERAQRSWVFNGPLKAYYKEGGLKAVFHFQAGKRQGLSTTYFPNGQLKEEAYYLMDKRDGSYTTYLVSGVISQSFSYENGLLHGPAKQMQPQQNFHATEIYDHDLLLEGQYYLNEELLSFVEGGKGLRVSFPRGEKHEQEFEGGLAHGKLLIYTPDAYLIKQKHFQKGLLHGLETHYYLSPSSPPQFTLEWKKGRVIGPVKVWHPNGELQSEFFIKDGLKEGVASAYYPNGDRMFHEEYHAGKLRCGRYYKRHEKQCYSEVKEGKGQATLFDEEGYLIDQILYENGEPV